MPATNLITLLRFGLLFLCWISPSMAIQGTLPSCPETLTDLNALRSTLRPSGQARFTHSEYVRIGDGSPRGLADLRLNTLHRPPFVFPGIDDYLMGIYTGVAQDSRWHTVFIHRPSSIPNLLTGDLVLVPHSLLFPFRTGQKIIVTAVVHNLLQLNLDFKKAEVVRFRSHNGLMQVGVVHTIHEDSIEVMAPDQTLLFPVPKSHVFKVLTQGEGDIIIPRKIFVPHRDSLIYGVVYSPQFELGLTPDSHFGEVNYRPPAGGAAEAFLNGAAKFTSLPHFLNQKIETQLELLLEYYQVFTEPHPIARHLMDFGIRDVEEFIAVGASGPIQHLALLGTLLVEAGFSTQMVMLPEPDKEPHLWFEVTVPIADTGKKKTYIVDPSLVIIDHSGTSSVINMDTIRHHASQDPSSKFLTVYLNPSRQYFSLSPVQIK